jgi:MerR family transcriptional regulator, light-induced transcriptional regulator
MSDHIETASVGNTVDDQRLARLSRLIEGEIIPRLLICHTVTSRKLTATSVATHPTPADVAELARLMLEPDRGLADAYLESLWLRGASRGLLCAELLAPTAKRLGELWERDVCDFAALTDGLQRLESVLNEFRDR